MEAVGQFDRFRFSLPPEAGRCQIERRIRTHDDRREGWQLVLLAKSDQQRFRVLLLAPGVVAVGKPERVRTRRWASPSRGSSPPVSG